MLVRVLVGGAVAAADVAARKAESRLDPGVSKTEALLTAGGRVRRVLGRREEMFARLLIDHHSRLLRAEFFELVLRE